MASIVMGMGLSHGPTVILDPEVWVERAASEARSSDRTLNTLDGRFLTYAELLAERGERFAADATIENFRRQAEQCRKALDRLAEDLASVAPDVLVVIGSDQDELYRADNVPALAIYHGAMVSTWQRDQSGYPDWRRRVTAAYGMDRVHHYAGAPELARELIERLTVAGFDLTAMSSVPDPLQLGFGHAWGFVAERLFKDRPVPMVPLLLNGFRGPNRPTPRRCYQLGRALRAAVEAMATPHRVAVVASGGLSHMLCEESLDRQVLRSILAGDDEALCTLPVAALQSGSSEIRAWVTLAGATSHLESTWLSYVPVYRTPVGSGMGCAFGLWREKSIS